jgi:hypothetical protein
LEATTTGSPVITNANGFIVYTFADSGTLTW